MVTNTQELATLKKPNEPLEYSSKEEFEQMIRDIAHAKRDIVWWAENFFRIVSLNTGLGIIKLYQRQKEMLHHLVTHDRNIVLASRQTGKCVYRDSQITVRNKKTGEVKTLSIRDFFDAIKVISPIDDFSGQLSDTAISNVQIGSHKRLSSSMELSDTVERKFIESLDVDDYEVLTDAGWKSCNNIHKTVEYRKWKLVTERHMLECADTHIVFDASFNQIFVKDLRKGMKIQTDTGTEEVISIEEETESDNMYDIEVDSPEHRYFTNGILSHNTTTYTVFVLWYATLFPEKKIMICANKLQTAIEIMDRIRIGYEYLPKFIKPGITVYNKQEISFANKSSIRAFATSSSASRGFSAQCVSKDTKITIRLFKFLKMTIPISWLRFICREKKQMKHGDELFLYV